MLPLCAVVVFLHFVLMRCSKFLYEMTAAAKNIKKFVAIKMAAAAAAVHNIGWLCMCLCCFFSCFAWHCCFVAVVVVAIIRMPANACRVVASLLLLLFATTSKKCNDPTIVRNAYVCVFGWLSCYVHVCVCIAVCVVSYKIGLAGWLAG